MTSNGITPHEQAIAAGKSAYMRSVEERPHYTGTHIPRAPWETLPKWEKACWIPESLLRNFQFGKA